MRARYRAPRVLLFPRIVTGNSRFNFHRSRPAPSSSGLSSCARAKIRPRFPSESDFNFDPRLSRFRRRSYLIANYAVAHAPARTSLSFSLPRLVLFFSSPSISHPFPPSFISIFLFLPPFLPTRSARQRATHAYEVLRARRVFDVSGGADYGGLIIDDDKNLTRKMLRGGKQRKHGGNVRLRRLFSATLRDSPETSAIRAVLAFFSRIARETSGNDRRLRESRVFQAKVELSSRLGRYPASGNLSRGSLQGPG